MPVIADAGELLLKMLRKCRRCKVSNLQSKCGKIFMYRKELEAILSNVWYHWNAKTNEFMKDFRKVKIKLIPLQEMSRREQYISPLDISPLPFPLCHSPLDISPPSFFPLDISPLLKFPPAISPQANRVVGRTVEYKVYLLTLIFALHSDKPASLPPRFSHS